MRKRTRKSRKRQKPKRTDQEAMRLGKPGPVTKAEPEQIGPHYAAGPMVGISPRQEAEANAGRDGNMEIGRNVPESEMEVAPLPTVQGTGVAEHVQVHSSFGGTLQLEGRTDADFDGGAFFTEDVTIARGSDCVDCSTGECIHVTGVLVAVYAVKTDVTLPSVGEFSDLTACQRRRVQQAIDTVLAPHEQQHVRAFNTYNGSTRRSFDLTLCRSEFNSTIRSMFETEAENRRQAVQSASDALDPFHFDVDLNCIDEETDVEIGQPDAEEPDADPEVED